MKQRSVFLQPVGSSIEDDVDVHGFFLAALSEERPSIPIVMRPSLVAFALVGFTLAACGASSTLQLARRGDIARLGVELRARQSKGALGHAEVEELSRITAEN